MAANHSTLATISDCISRVPALAIPDIGITETKDGRVTFTVQTPFGPISVEGSRAKHGNGLWRCRGNAKSLAAHCLLQPDWLPGLPGNNKVRQTVLFGADGPKLFLGNRRGSKLNVEFISIERISKTFYTVVIPATEEQTKKIRLVYETWLQSRQSQIVESQTQAVLRQVQIRQATASKQEIRDGIYEMVTACKGLVSARLDYGAYRFSPEADRKINELFAQLLSWVGKGLLENAGLDAHGGNVVRLRRRS